MGNLRSDIVRYLLLLLSNRVHFIRYDIAGELKLSGYIVAAKYKKATAAFPESSVVRHNIDGNYFEGVVLLNTEMRDMSVRVLDEILDLFVKNNLKSGNNIRKDVDDTHLVRQYSKIIEKYGI